jgi:molybdopterin molybdotransferase
VKPTQVELADAGDKTLPLHWFRLVTLSAGGVAHPVISLGSGDLVSMGHSDGFVELPPGGTGKGPWPFYGW